MTAPRSRSLLVALAVAGFALLLFFGYAYLALLVPGMDASPDESANRLFSRTFTEHQRLYVFERLNQIFESGPIHPRSTLLVDDLTLPAGFIGLPFLYGAIGMAAGIGVQPFLTPMLAVLAVLAWSGIIREAYGRRAGVIAGMLLATNEAWWYWSARTFMPNVPFLSFMVIGAWFALTSPIRRALPASRLSGLADAMSAGAAFGVALSIRLSEGPWIAIGLFVALLAARRLPWRRLALVSAFAAMTFAPVGALNHSLYGDPFFAGYAGASEAVSSGAPSGGFGARLLGPVGPVLFPLGFAPRTALAHFSSFGIGLFPQWTAIVVASALILLAFGVMDRRKGAIDRVVAEGPGPEIRRGFLWGGLAASVWLVAAYGSWTVRDNPDPSAVTIGASYVRYWLPLFMLSTIPVAVAVARMLVSSSAHRALAYMILAFAVVFGPYAAFTAPQEGLETVHRVLVRDRAVRDAIMARTAQDAVIVVDHADKFLHPYRRVVQPLRSDRTYTALPTLVRHAPVYYFGITFPQKDMDWLNTEKLPPLGVSLRLVETFDERSLYVFTRTDGVITDP